MNYNLNIIYIYYNNINMIIPIRCFTCGEIMADKWIPFIERTNELRNIDTSENNLNLNIETIDIQNMGKKTIEGKVLDELKLHKYCCRRMMLTNVPLITYIN